MAIFYCLRFKIPPIWRARFPYLCSPGTRWTGYTPRHWVPLSSPPTTRRATVDVFDPTFTREETEKVKVIQIYKNSVRTSQETHYVSATKPNRLMLFREIIAVYCENHTEHTNTLCRQNAEFSNVEAGGTYSYHYV
jgi:hypothetical protein